MEDRKYYNTDIESGETYEVSREVWEAIQNMWECAKPILRNAHIEGQLLIVGTAGEINNKGLEEIFYNPQNYEIIKWNKDESKNV